ncbi:hypothetical protein SCHPADRAFT_118543 [Schizopora paradoxa]|uniref:Uncharacterized protein n=1 Tax=Schizopora paradoxa TaxID=27342 RepID=A0A0H2S3D0_9AGAM|nr:hypothetical protein SCHPADRAFT_118543 [Schizopora paradoxa]
MDEDLLVGSEIFIVPFFLSFSLSYLISLSTHLRTFSSESLRSLRHSRTTVALRQPPNRCQSILWMATATDLRFRPWPGTLVGARMDGATFIFSSKMYIDPSPEFVVRAPFFLSSLNPFLLFSVHRFIHPYRSLSSFTAHFPIISLSNLYDPLSLSHRSLNSSKTRPTPIQDTMHAGRSCGSRTNRQYPDAFFRKARSCEG